MTDQKHIAVWDNCLRIIKDNIPPSSFKTWFVPIKAVKFLDSVLTIEVPSDFFREYLEEQFIELIGKTLRRVVGSSAKLEYNVRVVSNEEAVTMPQQGVQELTNKTVPFPAQAGTFANPFVIPGLQQRQIDPQLNPNFNFRNFVEGECNRLARAAGLNISSSPGNNSFNPLFLYGGSGLGKTHLAQAIGIEIKERFPDKIVLYVSANRFQTQFMDAANVKNKLTDFLHFYQMIDVLIIDDVHEFAGKPGTQNAFFHIFSHLHNIGKQLILTSDKAPSELQDLEQRLLSRFKWGLVAELVQPDFETRIAILKAKSYKDGIVLPEEVITYLANNITTNVREIEGTLISLLAQSTLTHREITLELAQSLTERFVSRTKTEISGGNIQKIVCEYFKISTESFLSQSRKREFVQARQIAMYISRNMTNNSLASIGAQIGGRDHATVLHAYNTVKDLIDTNRSFRKYVSDIEGQLKSN